MAHPLVGTWRVKTEGAPFPYHMFMFTSDGTMLQSNPPAGNAESSDTMGMGVWGERDGRLKARFEEYRVDVAEAVGTITRGVIDFNLVVDGDALTGDCAFNIYDPETGEHLAGPKEATLEGQRVTLDWATE